MDGILKWQNIASYRNKIIPYHNPHLQVAVVFWGCILMYLLKQNTICSCYAALGKCFHSRAGTIVASNYVKSVFIVAQFHEAYLKGLNIKMQTNNKSKALKKRIIVATFSSQTKVWLWTGKYPQCLSLGCCGSGSRLCPPVGGSVDHVLTPAVYMSSILGHGTDGSPISKWCIWVVTAPDEQVAHLSITLHGNICHQCVNGWMLTCNVKSFVCSLRLERHYISTIHLLHFTLYTLTHIQFLIVCN